MEPAVNHSAESRFGTGNDGRLPAGADAQVRQRYRPVSVLAAAAPVLLWIILFFIVPMLLIVLTSFWTRGEYGTVEREWTFENYKRLAGFGWLGFDPVYPLIVMRSLIAGFCTALLCLAFGLPLAFFIAGLPDRFRVIGLILVVIPFWTNLLIRTYAWQVLLGPDSWLSACAVWLGWIEAGEGLYPGVFAVGVGLVCDYLPFMVLPLYASVEKVDWTLADAARDLGAHGWGLFRYALLPQIKPGLIAGGILVFLPATGQFVVPDLLGGAKTFLIGNAIQQQFGAASDWPFGAAMAVATLMIVLAGLWVLSRSGGKQMISTG